MRAYIYVKRKFSLKRGKNMNTTIKSLGNPEYKDRLFKFIFGRDTEESKRWRLQLYNALNGTNVTDPDELKINTIENVIYITMHNDISFLVDSEMNLWEEQSTYNPNMPLRGFFYFAALYQTYLAENEKNLISSSRIMIPRPRFYVFYHGGPGKADRWEMSLSDSFLNPDKSGAFEWTATIINLHPNHNSTLNKNCTPLYHYVKFTAKISENIKAGMNKQEAIERAVNYAIENIFLEGFFKIHKAEVIGMCLTEFDEEEAKRIWHEDGFSEGLNQGLAEGAQQKAVEAAIKLLKMNLGTPEQIAEAQGLPLEKVLELQKNN